jgi:hypothetical protein
MVSSRSVCFHTAAHAEDQPVDARPRISAASPGLVVAVKPLCSAMLRNKPVIFKLFIKTALG